MWNTKEKKGSDCTNTTNDGVFPFQLLKAPIWIWEERRGVCVCVMVLGSGEHWKEMNSLTLFCGILITC